MTSSIPNRPTRALIDLEALADNFRKVREFLTSGVRCMAVVKADAYGHGAVECAGVLEREGIDWFGVALPGEGVELRRNGIRKRILCLGGFWEGQERTLLNHGITPVIFRLEQAEAFNSAAGERKSIAEVHLKIDTGMGRIGVRHDELDEFLDRFAKFDNLHVEGVMSHFAAADDPGQDEFTKDQIAKFSRAVSAVEARGHRPVYTDLANSAATVSFPEAHGNLVRLGGILYGLTGDSLQAGSAPSGIRPVMSLRTSVANLKTVRAGESLGYGRTVELERDSVIATLPIGYQDGYRRALSNRARVLVKGKFAPVVGRISMDWTLVDVTGIEGTSVGDGVVLIGAEDGSEIRAEELASICGTISYEITCGISRRVGREYLSSSQSA